MPWPKSNPPQHPPQENPDGIAPTTGEPPAVSTRAPSGADSAASDNARMGKASMGASLGVLFSRFSGTLRTQVLGWVFGFSASMDAFNLAFRPANTLRDLFAEGALSSAFTRELQTAIDEGDDSVRELFKIVSGFFLALTALLAVLGAVFAEPAMRAFGGATRPEVLNLARWLFATLVFYLPIASFCSLPMAMLGTLRQTFRAMVSSALFNVGNILGALLLAPLMGALKINPIYGLAIGALLGGMAQIPFLVGPIRQRGWWAMPQFSPRAWKNHAPLRTILRLMVPRMLSQGAYILTLTVSLSTAAGLGEGALTALNTSTTIILVPVGLFGVAAGFASLPMLSEAVARKNTDRLSALFVQSLESTQWLSFLSVAGFALLFVPGFVVLFQHGKTQWTDTLRVGLTVMGFAAGLIFTTSNRIVTQGFFALGEMRQVTLNACVQLLMVWLLTKPMAHSWGLLGLGWANSLAAGVDWVLNMWMFQSLARKKGLAVGDTEIWKEMLRRQPLYLALAVGFSLLGVAAVKGFWQSFQQIMVRPPSFLFATTLCLLGGAVFLVGVSLVVTKWGPATLRLTHDRLKSKGLRLWNRLFPPPDPKTPDPGPQ